MKTLILTVVIRMFMAFAGTQLVEDTEVYLVDAEAYEAKYCEMESEEILSVDRFLDREETIEFILEGIVYDNGDEFYVMGIDNDDFQFEIMVDENYDVLFYSISWY